MSGMTRSLSPLSARARRRPTLFFFVFQAYVTFVDRVKTGGHASEAYRTGYDRSVVGNSFP